MLFRRRNTCGEEARKAREERLSAEQQLQKQLARRPEIDEITARLEFLREQNNFGHKIEVAMARRRAH